MTRQRNNVSPSARPFGRADPRARASNVSDLL